MRVISGEQRGKLLRTLEGEAVRPTSDRVKESLFNILQFQLEGRKFLDLFAGSGQIGIEAVSRGAKEAVLVDSSKKSIAVIEDNLKSTNLADRARVICDDSVRFIANSAENFDTAFLDPPYEIGLIHEALPLVAKRMNNGGTIICEHPISEELPQSAGEFVKAKSYKYGKILLTVYLCKEVAERVAHK